jgi:hypothetical protein
LARAGKDEHFVADGLLRRDSLHTNALPPQTTLSKALHQGRWSALSAKAM